MHEYHYEPHLQLEQVYTVRNSQVLDTLESKEGGWGDIIQCKLSMYKKIIKQNLKNLSYKMNDYYIMIES